MTVVSAEVDLFNGIAAILVTAGVGVLASDATPDDIAIVLGDLPQEPSQVIAITPYAVASDPLLNESIIGAQVMLRGTTDPRSVLDVSAAVFNEFQGLENRDFGSMHLALMWLQSGRLDGKDDAKRWLSSENYYCRVNWATRYRTD